MSRANQPNVLLVHGGAPTSVLNASLAGTVAQLQRQKQTGKILAARFGSQGILDENFIDLSAINSDQLQKLKYTPGSAIGTSRTPLSDPDYERICEILKKNKIGAVFFTGGNGSMSACGKIWQQVQQDGIMVVGIPKTIDNDIMVTDHAPGYASCANYVAATVKEMAQDVKSLPIHIVVLEVMGRNTGWLAAASALARDEHTAAPHLICFPEVPFDETVFLTKAETLYRKFGGVIVVASEGLKFKDGTHIVPPIFQIGQAIYFGDVSSHLANLIIKKLGIKARSEKPGILTRCAVPYVIPEDIVEAEMVGEEAVRTASNGIGGVMIGLKRLSTSPYQVELIQIPIEQVMLHERVMPKEFMNTAADDVTQDFLDWARPLVNRPQPFISFV
jgi:6-phosphofructokinase 1